MAARTPHKRVQPRVPPAGAGRALLPSPLPVLPRWGQGMERPRPRSADREAPRKAAPPRSAASCAESQRRTRPLPPALLRGAGAQEPTVAGRLHPRGDLAVRVSRPATGSRKAAQSCSREGKRERRSVLSRGRPVALQDRRPRRRPRTAHPERRSPSPRRPVPTSNPAGRENSYRCHRSAERKQLGIRLRAWLPPLRSHGATLARPQLPPPPQGGACAGSRARGGVCSVEYHQNPTVPRPARVERFFDPPSRQSSPLPPCAAYQPASRRERHPTRYSPSATSNDSSRGRAQPLSTGIQTHLVP